ncbi:MAG: FAD-dependent oxidoreductase [Gammaproteobacteria bacterium]|nr:FAD-dependent oxidoreductase [Gammaproteobacteria bacterium]
MVIIGGGIGGVSAAIESAKTGRYRVTLLEKNESVLRGTSNATPGRMGLGFHYVHKETALMYLRETVAFARHYIAEVNAFGQSRGDGGLRIGEFEEESHYLRKGQYFITRDSLYSKEKILETYDAIKEEYSFLCETDHENKLFGEPDNIYRIMDPSEYKDSVNNELIICGIETSEHLLNWPLFRDYLEQELIKYNVSVKCKHEVESFESSIETQKRVVVAKNTSKIKMALERIEADIIINASWQNVESLTAKAGLQLPTSKRYELLFVSPEMWTLTPLLGKQLIITNMSNEALHYRVRHPRNAKEVKEGVISDIDLNLPSGTIARCIRKGSLESIKKDIFRLTSTRGDTLTDEPYRTNRLKIIARVKLPKALESASSKFFCIGPHCMFSNLGNGEGMMTYAKVTNFFDETATEVSGKMNDYLTSRVRGHSREFNSDALEELMAKGQEIVDGVSLYVPAMEDALLISTDAGVVITWGSVNIFAHDSTVHQRNYSGLAWHDFPLDFISNTTMKLLYGLDNAMQIVKIADEHMALRDQIPELVNKLLSVVLNREHEDEGLNQDIRKALAFILRNLSSKEVKAIRDSLSHDMIKGYTDQSVSLATSSSSSQATDLLSPPEVDSTKADGSPKIFASSLGLFKTVKHKALVRMELCSIEHPVSGLKKI